MRQLKRFPNVSDTAEQSTTDREKEELETKKEESLLSTEESATLEEAHS